VSGQCGMAVARLAQRVTDRAVTVLRIFSVSSLRRRRAPRTRRPTQFVEQRLAFCLELAACWTRRRRSLRPMASSVRRGAAVVVLRPLVRASARLRWWPANSARHNSAAVISTPEVGHQGVQVAPVPFASATHLSSLPYKGPDVVVEAEDVGDRMRE